MRLALPIMLFATTAHAEPKCPTPTIKVYKTLEAARAAMKAEPIVSLLEVEQMKTMGNAFFVDVPMGSPDGDDAVRYRVDAFFVRQKDVVVVDDLARWLNVIPAPGYPSPKSPAKEIRADAKGAHVVMEGFRELRVDVANGKLLGCQK